MAFVKTETIGVAIALVVAVGSSAGWNYERMRAEADADSVVIERVTRVETAIEFVQEDITEIKELLKEIASE